MNTQFGVMALPSVLLFHNSRPIFKYNFTDYNLASFSQFINILTGDNIPSVPQEYILLTARRGKDKVFWRKTGLTSHIVLLIFPKIILLVFSISVRQLIGKDKSLGFGNWDTR